MTADIVIAMLIGVVTGVMVVEHHHAPLERVGRRIGFWLGERLGSGMIFAAEHSEIVRRWVIRRYGPKS